MRLLVIEDDELVASALQRGLKASYAVDVVYSGTEGLHQAELTSYDLILLDLHLPDVSGAEVCQRLRNQGFTMPIIVLTGAVAVKNKISLLDMGADDYVTKPFSLDEVQARIRAALRRTTPYADNILSLEGLELDPAARTVLRNGQTVQLRRKEFDILEYLLRNHGKAVSRAMIVSNIWDMNENLWANVVDVHIKHLRDKIDRPFNSNLIQTVHGVGYKLEAASNK